MDPFYPGIRPEPAIPAVQRIAPERLDPDKRRQQPPPQRDQQQEPEEDEEELYEPLETYDDHGRLHELALAGDGHVHELTVSGHGNGHAGHEPAERGLDGADGPDSGQRADAAEPAGENAGPGTALARPQDVTPASDDPLDDVVVDIELGDVHASERRRHDGDEGPHIDISV
jgi:hypothetical protein